MIPIRVSAMSKFLAYRNAPRLAAYLAPPLDDVVTRLRPAPRSAPVIPAALPPAEDVAVHVSRTSEQNRAPQRAAG